MPEDSDRNFQEVMPRWITQQPGFVRPIDQSCSRGDLFELLEQVGQDAYNQFRCFWRGELDESADTRVRELRLLNDCVFALSMQANYEIMLEEGKEAAFQSVEEATPEKLQDLLTARDPIRRKLAIRKWSTLDDTFVAYLSDTARNKEKDTYVRREALDRLGDLSRLNDELIKLVDDIVNEETNPICLRFAAANLIWKHGLFATKGIDQTKLLEAKSISPAYAKDSPKVISIASHGQSTTNVEPTITLAPAEQDERKEDEFMWDNSETKPVWDGKTSANPEASVDPRKTAPASSSDPQVIQQIVAPLLKQTLEVDAMLNRVDRLLKEDQKAREQMTRTLAKSFKALLIVIALLCAIVFYLAWSQFFPGG